MRKSRRGRGLYRAGLRRSARPRRGRRRFYGRAHARHGTTSVAPTTAVAAPAPLRVALDLARAGVAERGFGLWDGEPGARVLGAHFYGPYFAPGAEGCHPAQPLRLPEADEYADYLRDDGAVCTASVAPELPGAEAFARAVVARGICLNLGHSNATFAEVAAAIGWGAQHVDHLFCAMSDKSKLRSEPGAPSYPMRGGLLEAALYFDELSTEVIADGRHLAPDLLRLALKFKGPERVILVTDCNRALDMPDGRALASGCMGMDHMVRTFYAQTGAALEVVVPMASATPAAIVGRTDIGSLEKGKCADVLILNEELVVQRVFVAGQHLV